MDNSSTPLDKTQEMWYYVFRTDHFPLEGHKIDSAQKVKDGTVWQECSKGSCKGLICSNEQTSLGLVSPQRNCAIKTHNRLEGLINR